MFDPLRETCWTRHLSSKEGCRAIPPSSDWLRKVWTRRDWTRADLYELNLYMIMIIMMLMSDQPTAIQDTWHKRDLCVFYDKFGYDSMTFYKLMNTIDSDSPTAV